MSSKLEPTPLGLPIEIRRIIWGMMKPRDLMVDLLNDIDKYGDYVGRSAIDDIEACPLFLVNHQLYEEMFPIYNSKTRLTIAVTGFITESNLPSMSYINRNLVTRFTEWIHETRCTDAFVERWRSTWEKEYGVYYHKVTVEVAEGKRSRAVPGGIEHVSLDANIYVKDEKRSIPPRQELYDYSHEY